MDDSNTIIETNKDTIKVIRFNKPHKKNAIDGNMYNRVTKILNEAAFDDSVSMVVVTGTADFYSSGNDVSNSWNESEDEHMKVLRDFIEAFITFPKLLIAIVNGPAIGIAATTLALCDLVYASENAYFYTPFPKLHITAEGGSTLTFPRLIGQRKAAEMLLFNHKMTAKEALEYGFINRMYKPEELETKAWDKINEISKLPADSILATKNLLRRVYYDDLLKTNDVEIAVLKKSLKAKSNL
ncbi:Enoyl-CoA delta isomerase 2, mitochondrial [Papilio xuthus]|uniref:Enoyl-CoA delta isomerase 2, mitochondrial n=1 Tax=Papilio xuthus TaxID=66420 RepID=A0A194Q1S3_PAPXU|nr:Enoyl-CoA delta isomerase 2, mitochondrial [Papilio xuthus]